MKESAFKMWGGKTDVTMTTHTHTHTHKHTCTHTHIHTHKHTCTHTHTHTCPHCTLCSHNLPLPGGGGGGGEGGGRVITCRATGSSPKSQASPSESSRAFSIPRSCSAYSRRNCSYPSCSFFPASSGRTKGQVRSDRGVCSLW